MMKINILRSLKNVLCSSNDAFLMAQKLKQYATIVESIDLTLLLLDKKGNIIEIYNIDHVEKVGISQANIATGKHFRYYATDKSSVFYDICDAIEETIEKVSIEKLATASEYKIFDSYLKISASIIDEQILIQIKDITNIRNELQKLESSNYNELSMALSAGGLISWKYDTRTRIVSSSSNNTITGQEIPFDDLINDHTLPEYHELIYKMINDIVENGVTHREVTIRSIDSSGDVKWINIHAIPYAYDDNGIVSIIAGSQKDITLEYEYNQKIRRLNEQNEMILNNIKSALVYITPDYKVVWENVSIVYPENQKNQYYKTGAYCYASFGRDTPCENCVMQKVMSSHKSESIEVITPDYISIDMTANPIIGNNDEIEGIILKIDDVTDKNNSIQKLKIAQQEAAAANSLLSTILNNLPSSVFVKNVDDNNKYIIANKQLCKDLGLSENDIIGKTDFDIFPKEEAEQYLKDDNEVIESNSTKCINEHVSMKNATTVSYTIKSPLINTENNNQRLLVGISTDMTERYNAYQELAIAKKKAEEADKLKSAFLANMSHEIRTPLNAIVGFSGLMEACDDPEEKAEYMRIISTNNELLLRLINDILDLSKLDSGIIQFNESEFDLVQFFDELSASMKQQITNPNIEFIAVNPYKSCIVYTDKSRMAQVWHNFMTNAIKYTVSGYIKMGYEYVDDGIKIYVEDTGIGIAEDKKNKLFQRFEKLDSFAQGTGLGLSICKAITELGGGKVGFKSTEGKGSLFWSWKPIKVMNIDKIECESQLSHESEQEVNIADIEDYMKKRNCKILIAEDNDSNFFLVNHILKNTFQISRAINGFEAVEFVKNNPVDIVLMDMKMPVMDGLEATRQIREFNKDISIIALTANAFDSDRNDALESGCNDFITKPVHKKTLLLALYKMCLSKLR